MPNCLAFMRKSRFTSSPSKHVTITISIVLHSFYLPSLDNGNTTIGLEAPLSIALRLTKTVKPSRHIHWRIFDTIVPINKRTVSLNTLIYYSLIQTPNRGTNYPYAPFYKRLTLLLARDRAACSADFIVSFETSSICRRNETVIPCSRVAVCKDKNWLLQFSFNKFKHFSHVIWNSVMRFE